jgi:deazaflavin-dependent oxidoreductase (nitroreductase family)
MSGTYLRPPWFASHVGNRMASLFGRRFVSKLTVAGRSSGKERAVPVAVLDQDGARYLVAPRGDTHWARNLRAAGGGRLRQGGRDWEFSAEEVPVAARPSLIAAYRSHFDRFPMVAKTFEQLPDPADHPVFRLTARESG